MEGVAGEARVHLLPETVARLVETGSLEELVATVGADVFLFEVQAGQEELESVLAAWQTSATLPLVATLGFRTVMARRPSRAAVERMAAGAAGELDERARLRALLAAHTHVVVPVRKREVSGKAFSSRISVGRAMNNDIVLRDESVSKFHAWLEVDEEGKFFVTDAGSRNGTYVAGERLPPKQCARVSPGEELRFANIASAIWPSAWLWSACRDT